MNENSYEYDGEAICLITIEGQQAERFLRLAINLLPN